MTQTKNIQPTLQILNKVHQDEEGNIESLEMMDLHEMCKKPRIHYSKKGKILIRNHDN